MRTRSTANRPFADRQDAGRQLAEGLEHLHGTSRLLVLGLPRGGVPVAAEVAQQLDARLDIVLVRKVGVPGRPELAMGAVAAAGGSRSTVRNERVIAGVTGGDAVFREVAARERAELDRRELSYRPDRPPVDLAGRSVIIVDDGVATGATMRAALEAVRRLKPAEITAAAPVFLGQSLSGVRLLADRTVCTWAAESLGSVGHAYVLFDQVADEEFQRLLQQRPRE